jgi:hypothetical protein
VLTDTSEELQEVATRTFGDLNKPFNRVLAGGSAAGVASAVTFPHTTFQAIGIVGIELTILRALLSYDSPGALIRDWSYRAGQAAKMVSDLGAKTSKRIEAQRASQQQSSTGGARADASAVAEQPDAGAVSAPAKTESASVLKE